MAVTCGEWLAERALHRTCSFCGRRWDDRDNVALEKTQISASAAEGSTARRTLSPAEPSATQLSRSISRWDMSIWLSLG